MKDLRWLEENCPYIYKRGGFANRQDTVCRPSAIRSADGTITPFSPIPTSAQPPSSVAAAKTPAAKASRGVPSPESEASAHAPVSASAAPAYAAQLSAAAGDEANLWTSAVAAAREEQQNLPLALVTASARSERSDRNADANAMIQDDQQKQPDGEPRPLGILPSTKRDDCPPFDVPALVEALKVGITIRPLANVRLAAFLRGAEEGSPVFFFRGGSIAFSSQLRGVAGVCLMSEGQLVLVGGAEPSLCSEAAMQALASCGRPIVPCFSSGKEFLHLYGRATRTMPPSSMTVECVRLLVNALGMEWDEDQFIRQEKQVLVEKCRSASVAAPDKRAESVLEAAACAVHASVCLLIKVLKKYAKGDPVHPIPQIFASMVGETGTRLTIGRNHPACLTYYLMRDAQAAICLVETCGIAFDSRNHAQLLQAWERELNDAKRHTRQLTGLSEQAMNIRSNQQLGDWIESRLNGIELQKWPRTKTGALKVDKATLQTCCTESVQKALSMILNVREMEKKISAYGPFAEHVRGGRLYPTYILGGAVTGRLATKDPNLHSTLRCDEFRSLFAAPPGRALIVADYSQIELRVLAELSRDENMLSAFRTGDDLHTFTASRLLSIPPQQVTKEQRRLAKAVNFGLVYGQGASGLRVYAQTSFGVQLTENEAKTALKLFFQTYPAVALWQQRIRDTSQQHKSIQTPAGRIRHFALVDDRIMTESLNTPVQGGAAEVALLCLSLLYNTLEAWQTDTLIVGVIHDEFILECCKRHASEVQRLVESCMVRAFSLVFPRAPTRGLVSSKVAQTWSEGK
ncbi:unnamed protein product [Vitrella brassicaformis CCMP3155]|uniref:DNA-directed DNA polymerase n=3 Tax=Vitrella brassicaformis TaxID=1169539 RepID=A0A0G4EWL8_VITBC|nr:unnamed protein product [Vitrella brassicaformis CCMP3155]|eukprot:CEM02751.1 unnamed protein product [Vitrella brassicaformis CCMP3155]